VAWLIEKADVGGKEDIVEDKVDVDDKEEPLISFGEYRLVNTATGGYIAAAGRVVSVSKEPSGGNKVVSYIFHNPRISPFRHLQWRVTALDNGQYTIQSRDNSRFACSTAQSLVGTNGANDDPKSQKWEIESTDTLGSFK
jgi:hypothetical protein